MRPAWAGLAWATGTAFSALWVAGCVTNPATGKSNVVLMSEASEIALRRKYHARIVDQQYKRCPDPALRNCVQKVGERAAASSLPGTAGLSKLLGTRLHRVGSRDTIAKLVAAAKIRRHAAAS